MLYIIYRLILVFYIIKQWIKHIKNGDHIVRNSPLDPISTMLKNVYKYIKSCRRCNCRTGITFALCHEFDDLLEKEGKNKYIIPHLKARIK